LSCRRPVWLAGVPCGVARLRLDAPHARARARRLLAHVESEQRRLADPVRPQDHEPVTAAHLQVDAVQDLVLAERLLHAPDPQHLLAARPTLFEAELRVAPRAARERGQPLGHALDQPRLALRLPGLARLRAEPIHEALELLDLLLSGLDLLLPPLPDRLLLLQEG